MSYFPTSGAGGYTPQTASVASRSLTSNGATTVVNVTEAGFVEAIVIEMTTAITTGVTAGLKFTVDGAAAVTRNVINGNTFLDWVQACPGNGTGVVNNDRRQLPISFPYSTSLKIEIDCVTSSIGGGTMQCTVLRSKRN